MSSDCGNDIGIPCLPSSNKYKVKPGSLFSPNVMEILKQSVKNKNNYQMQELFKFAKPGHKLVKSRKNRKNRKTRNNKKQQKTMRTRKSRKYSK